jgi:hypothetical protein
MVRHATHVKSVENDTFFQGKTSFVIDDTSFMLLVSPKIGLKREPMLGSAGLFVPKNDGGDEVVASSNCRLEAVAQKNPSALLL